MANEGHIIVKGKRLDGRKFNMQRFYRPVDAGSAKPAFCYPRRRQDLQEEVDRMRRNLDEGNVAQTRKMKYKMQLKEREDRLDQINESFDNAKKVIDEDPDAWNAYRNELAEKISAGLPTREDERMRRVNPHRRLREEKGGLESMKRQYVIVSRALGEESNTSFLQKEK